MNLNNYTLLLSHEIPKKDGEKILFKGKGKTLKNFKPSSFFLFCFKMSCSLFFFFHSIIKSITLSLNHMNKLQDVNEELEHIHFTSFYGVMVGELRIRPPPLLQDLAIRNPLEPNVNFWPFSL